MKTCITAKDTSQPTMKPKRNRKTPDNSTFFRQITDKYCWTHGGSNHLGKDCRTKAPGHKDAATFDDKMGGSKAYCRV